LPFSNLNTEMIKEYYDNILITFDKDKNKITIKRGDEVNSKFSDIAMESSKSEVERDLEKDINWIIQFVTLLAC